MDLNLGTAPATLRVWLVDAAPFTAAITTTTAFPTAPELLFDDGTTWPATLDPDATTAAWSLTATDVQALAAAGPKRVTLRDPGTHHVWAHGSVFTTRVAADGPASSLAPGGSITVEQLDGALAITYSSPALTPVPDGNGYLDI